MLEQDKERRRIRLGMKQLEPTSIDHFIAEHKVGDEVAGRVVEVSSSRVKAELGEGVFAVCRLQAAEPQAAQAESKSAGPKVDLSSMTEMLKARWKQGGGGASEGGQPARDQIKPGQVRNFRITALDSVKKTIDIELV